MSYHIIAGVSNEWGIGNNNKLPWSCKNDMKYFSKKTKGEGNNAIVMGRNTWESIGSKCLPKRENIVLSKSLTQEDCSANAVFSNILSLQDYCNNKKFDEIWIIGGAQIYTLFLESNLCSSVHISHINTSIDCDTFFPEKLLTENWKDILNIDLQDTNYVKIYIPK